MAKVFGDPPFALAVIDSDSDIAWADVEPYLKSQGDSVALLVRNAVGNPGRGGFFFCLERDDEILKLFDFAGEYIVSFSAAELIEFINHATGRAFSQAMLSRCQKEINFRFDPD